MLKNVTAGALPLLQLPGAPSLPRRRRAPPGALPPPHRVATTAARRRCL